MLVKNENKRVSVALVVWCGFLLFARVFLLFSHFLNGL
jgi:hypothetical protein